MYNCKYSQIIGCHNNWIIIVFLDDGTYDEYYNHINQNILYDSVMNMSLIIMKGKYGDIYTDDSSCHGYCIIKFSSSPYTHQSDLIIDGQVISSGEMACKENYFFPINNNSHFYF